jgi:hypothetical protein
VRVAEVVEHDGLEGEIAGAAGDTCSSGVLACHRLRAELGFYIRYLNLCNRLAEVGEPLSQRWRR